MASRELTITFLGDAKPLQSAFGGAEKAASDMAGKMKHAEQSLSSLSVKADGTHGPLGKLSGALGGVAKIAAGFVVAQGIQKLGGFLVEAAQAAAEDEQATARLNTTLRTLTDESGKLGPTFERASAAMDGLIKSGQKLAFSDDEIRDSMGKLLDSTGNMEEATARLAAAQDLARGRGIPLADATKLLGKLSDENIQIFKRLGITMREGATEAEVLATVQQKFGGQAEAYAKSTAGQFEQLKIRLSELKESIGYALLPIMTKLGEVLVNNVAPAVEALTTAALGLAQAGWEKISGPLGTIAGMAWDGFVAGAGALKDFALAGVELAKADWDKISGPLGTIAGMAWDGFVAGAGALKDFALAGVELAKADWDKISGPLAALAAAQFDKVAPQLADIGTSIKGLDLETFAGAWTKVKDELQPAIDALRPFAEDLLVSLKGNLTDIIAAFSGLFEALKPLEPLLKPLAIVLGVALVVALAAAMKGAELLGDAMALALVVPVKAATLVIEAATVAFTAMYKFVVNTLIPGIQAFGEKIGEISDKVGTAMADARDKVNSVGGEVISAAVTIGGQIVTGLWNGIQGLWWKVTDGISRLVNLIPSGVRSILGIGSPSRVFHEIGEQVGAGFGNGLGASLPPVMTYWSDKLSKWVTEVAAVAVGAGSAAGGFMTAAGGARPEYIGGGSYGFSPAGTDTSSTAPVGFYNPTTNSTWTGDGWTQGDWWRPGDPTTRADMAANVVRGMAAAPQTINLVVDGAVLAQVVNNQNARAY